MQRKLTLRIDSLLVEQAKRYGQAHGKSVSQLVAEYFAQLAPKEETLTLPPMTRSLLGVAAGSETNEDDYRNYLMRKHLGDQEGDRQD